MSTTTATKAPSRRPLPAKTEEPAKRAILSFEIPKCVYDLLEERAKETEGKVGPQARLVLKRWYKAETGKDAE